MNDLFTSTKEATDEREAIQVAEAIEFDESERHRCEVSWVIRTFYPDMEAAAKFLNLAETKRGTKLEKLRADCRIAWRKHAEEIAGQG